MHRLLERQVKRYLGKDFQPDESMQAFLSIINDYYSGVDKEQRLLLNALSVNSAELNTASECLRIQNAELNAANERLRIQNAEMTRTMLNTLSDGVYATDLKDNLTFMNAAAEETLGWSEQELIGRRVHHVIHHLHPDGSDFPSDDCPLLAVTRDGAPVEARSYFIDKQKRFIPVDYRSRPILQEEKIVGALVSFQDITLKLEADAKIQLQQAALDSAANIVVIADEHGMIEYVNAEFHKLTDYSTEDVIKQHFGILNPKIFDDLLLEKISHDNSYLVESSCIRKDGSCFDIELRAAPVYNEHGKALHFVFVLSDISSRKQAEVGMRLAYDHLQTTLNELEFQKYALDQHAIVSIAGRNGEITYANQSFIDISQYSEHELFGKNHRLLNSGYHSREFFSEMWQTISSGNIWHGEIRNRRKDGNFYWVDSTIVPFMNAQGKPVRYISIRTDITNRKNDEVLLQQSTQRLTLALEGSNIAMWDWDVASNHVYLSERWAEILGEEPGKTQTSMTALFERVHPDDRMMVQSRITAALKGEAAFFAAEHRIKHHDQHWVWISSRGKVVEQDETGRSLRMTGTKADISSRKQNEENLRLAKEAAEQANRAKSAFLATMSHEIRTPMNGVIGMIDVLQQSSLNSQQMEMTHIIHDSAFALLTIIDDILDFSKIEAGKFQIDCVPMEVAKTVEGVCETLAHTAEIKGVELTLFTDPTIPEVVMGDPLRLRQTLVNLAGNAIKFSSGLERKGRVSVRVVLVESKPKQVVLEFRILDNGIGIDKLGQARLFTPFTQADSTTTRNFGGTGLGLAICRQLVKLMGGEIAIQSEPDTGSLFCVRIPLALPTASHDPNVSFSLVAGLTCLVVGGTETLAGDLTSYLAHAGAQVEHVPDLVAAQKWIGLRLPEQCVIVIETAGVNLPLDDLRAAVHSRPDLDGRFVVIGRGRCHRGHVEAADLVKLDADGMHRVRFLEAVAIAAGRSQEYSMQNQYVDISATLMPVSREEARRQGCLILVAEDNEINQKVILQQLILLGKAADITCNGIEAFTHWQSGDYGLLLTDLHMPQMDGYELTTAIRTAEKNSASLSNVSRIPIIAFTANALKGEAEHCLAVDMDDYLSKPVQLVNLKAKLEKWLPMATESTPITVQDRVTQKNSIRPETDVTISATLAVDVSVLKALIGGDEAILHEFLHDFCLSAEKIAAELRTVCTAGQAVAASELAHKLKSSARSVGALALGELCAEMEKVGKSGDNEMLTWLLPKFEQELVNVTNYISVY